MRPDFLRAGVIFIFLASAADMNITKQKINKTKF